MKFEDYISSDILGNGRWQRPLPWKLTCAAGITLTAAGSGLRRLPELLGRSRSRSLHPAYRAFRRA